MKRKLLGKLIEWKNSPGRKPLMLEGARQVGKTYLLAEQFGKGCFDNVLRINFFNPSPPVIELFNGSIDARRIVQNLEAIYNVKIDPEKTLLFFDEIQEVPRALTALKSFYEDAPEYHLAVAGSLLGVFFKGKQSSFPVGMVNTLKLEPMDFEEFLWANGREQVASALKKDPAAKYFDEILLDLFRQYLVVGGMPEAVQSWVNEHNPEKISAIQSEITGNYTRDFSKHTGGDRVLATRIKQVFDSLPGQFAKNNDKFVYGVVKTGARAREYEEAIEWLVNADVARRVYNVSRGDKIPLKAHIDRSAFKLYFLDVGLFRKLADIPSKVIFDSHALFDEFKGLLAEQYVLQELATRALYYWVGSTTAEVDFVTQDDARILPIEVKSGTNLQAKSLRVYREKFHPELSVRFSLRDLKWQDGLVNIPLPKSFLFDDIIRAHP